MSYAGAVASLVGSEIQGWAAVLEQQAMEQALQAEMTKQHRLQNMGVYQLRSYLPSLSAENATKQLGQASTTRQAQYKAANATPLAPGANMSAADMAQLQLGGQQRANLGAYGDYLTNQSLASNRMQDIISRLGSRALGLQNVFPYTMDAAQHSQDLLAAIGSSIASIGGSGVNYQQLFGKQRPGTTTTDPYGNPIGNSPNNPYQGTDYYDSGGGGTQFGGGSYTNIA